MSTTALAAALVDRYRLERELGRGGMATVYLAHDLKHDRDVAIKVLHPELGAVLGAERFLSEIRTTANLQHPNILPLFDSGAVDGLVFYVMPFVAGETLRARLVREGQLSVSDAVTLAQDVAGALDYAHRHGVIHRDIKPENILLQDGRALVADFGVALAVSNAGGARITQTGISVGTPQYMSPEQAAAERQLDGRSDQYSLAAVLYEMLAGEPPFTGPSAPAILTKLMTEPVPPVTSRRPAVPLGLAAAIHRALEKVPADRFASAAQFAEALTRVQSGSTATGLRMPFGHRLHARALALAGTGLVLVGAVAGWLMRGAPSLLGRREPLVHAMPFAEARGWRNENRLAFSPDGAILAFVAPGADGVSRIWFRERTQLTGTPVAGTEGALNVIFSPDGARIAFLTDDPLVLRIATPGQPATVLGPVKAGISGGVGGAWARDGWIYLGGAGYGVIVRMRVADGAVEPVTDLVAERREAWHGQPALAPDGRSVVFTVADSSLRPSEFRIAAARIGASGHRLIGRGIRALFLDERRLLVVGADGTLRVGDLEAGETPLLDGPDVLGEALQIRGLATVDLAHSPAGRIAFVSTQGSAPDSAYLAWVSLEGRATRVAPSWTFLPGGDFALSRDGHRVAVTALGSTGPEIWLHDVATGRTWRATTGGGREPLFSPDGRDVLYLKSAGNQGVLYARPVDGSDGERIFMQQASAIHTDATWTPDGRTLVFETWRRGKGEDILMAVPSDSGRAVALLETEFNEMNPRLSPDGRWLTYVSDESGRVEVHLRPYPEIGSGHWQVSEHGGKEAEWSHDGRRLLYVDLTDTLRAVAITAGTGNPVGTPEPLFALGGMRRSGSILRSSYNVAPSGDRFLMAMRSQGARPSHQLVMIEDYPALLGARARRR